MTPEEVQTETGHGKRAQCIKSISVVLTRVFQNAPSDFLVILDAGEYLRAENEMLRLQLMLKTKELEAEQIQRLKLELDVKNKEIESLEKQNEELRAENERYRKTVSSTHNFTRIVMLPLDCLLHREICCNY
jgi:intein/homing endonuclease